jgi:alpha-galactosidase
MRVYRQGGAGDMILQAGQQTTHLKLHPGEVIRTPRMLLLAWRGNDSIEGHNSFRQLLLAHYLPRTNNEVAMPPVAEMGWFFSDPPGVSTEQNQLQLIQAASEIGVEDYWLDAGWYVNVKGWPEVGTWEPDPIRFPHGLKPVFDSAHKEGMKVVLWFEPERITPGSRIDKEHPDWVMHVRPGEEMTEIPQYQSLDENRLFKLGDPAARKWMTDLLSKCIEDWGLDVYRNDFNSFNAERFWKAADTPDRQGMAENLYIQGLYSMWDELLRRHPGLVIDNCASGGRRIDLELLSRSLPLWRSDIIGYGSDPNSAGYGPMHVWNQVETAGLSLYVPLHSTGIWSFDPYRWRSAATAGAVLCMDPRSAGFDKQGARRAINELKELRPLWLGNYYPLFDINLDERQWCGWQFDRPDLGRGFAMYFRRPKCADSVRDAGLRGLDPTAAYQVTFVDTGKEQTMTGKKLFTLLVTIPEAPGSVLITYKKIP